LNRTSTDSELSVDRRRILKETRGSVGCADFAGESRFVSSSDEIGAASIGSSLAADDGDTATAAVESIDFVVGLISRLFDFECGRLRTSTAFPPVLVTGLSRVELECPLSCFFGMRYPVESSKRRGSWSGISFRSVRLLFSLGFVDRAVVVITGGVRERVRVRRRRRLGEDPVLLDAPLVDRSSRSGRFVRSHGSRISGPEL